MKVTVRVPATSANLGPGFDVAGIALSLYNTYTFELLEQGLKITGCPKQFCNKNNLTYKAFQKGAKLCGLSYQGLRIDCSSKVPFTRGLGSSSTCIVAGIVAAYALKQKAIDKYEILQLATQMEGHPDNVAPAIFGGMTISIMDQDHIRSINIPMKHNYRFVALIPDFTLSTKKSREVLPTTLSRQETVSNTSHLGLLLASFVTGYDDGLKLGFEDCLHQPYRGHLIPGYFEIMDILKKDEKVLGAYLSGAGPTLMVVLKEEDQFGKERIEKLLHPYISSWNVLDLKIDKKGYQIME